MAGRLRQPDVSRNDGFEDVIPEKLSQVGGYQLGEVGTVVEHGEEDSLGLEGMTK